MAYVPTTVYQSKTTFIVDLACDDADVTGNIAHGLVGIPTLFEITRNVSPATTVIPNFAVTAGATNITVTKNNVAGSGGGVPGTTKVVRIVAKLPHSIS